MTSIEMKFELLFNSPVIQAKFFSNVSNNYKKGLMLFDTGAAITTISTRIADVLGYISIENKNTEVTGIGGSKYAEYSVIPELIIGSFNLGAVAVWVVDFSENMKSEAILGMNIIKNFNTNIIYDDNSDKKGKIIMHPRFNLNEIKTVNDFNYEYSRFGIWNINKSKQ